MLGRLLKRQIQPSMVYTSSGYVDSLGRVGRFFEGNWAGAYVDQNTALGIPAIYRGITLIADAIGALPLCAYRNKREVLPTPQILLRPVPTETRMETISAMAASLIIHGNYVAVLGDPGSNGLPDSIYPVSADRVQVMRANNGRIIYNIDDKVYEQSEILHIKNFTMPGDLVGKGILAVAKQALGKEIAINEYASRYFDGGVNPTAVIKSANPDLSQEEADALKSAWMAMYSSRNRSPVVMNSSTDFEVLSSNAAESQLVEAQTAGLTEAANILGLPPYFLGSPNSSRTYSNVEQENLQLIKWSIQPIAERIEAAFSDLLVRGQTAAFKYDSLLKTDTASRYDAYAVALSNGFLSVDEVRNYENLDPMDYEEDSSVDQSMQSDMVDTVEDENYVN
ncbi:phage portal protein [bacterium]|nr:phage portal protein [bacterium]